MILTDPDEVEARTELAKVVGAMLDRVASRSEAVGRADAAAAGHHDAALWTRINAEVGATGLAIPEERGGSGASFAELAVLAEATGRQLTTIPLLGTWCALDVLARSDADADREVVEHTLAEGHALAIVLEDAGITAEDHSGRWLLHGTADRVIDAVEATALVVPASVAGELRWFLVSADDVTRVRRESLDLTRSLAAVALDASPARLLAVQTGIVLLEEVRDRAAVLVAAEQLGVAEQALADAVRYAREREQFGRPIGSFQAMKHVLADMATDADLARSLVEHAVWAVVTGAADAPAVAAAALLESSRVACSVSAENVQVHGGIGFSWEHTAHLYFRKARSNEMLLGNRTAWSDRAFAGFAAGSGSHA